MFSELQYRILTRLFPRTSQVASQGAYQRKADLPSLMGPDFFETIAGKIVIDFGCGTGTDAVAMAKKGARRIIGIDILENYIQAARRKAAEAGVQDICSFTSSTAELADVVVSIDAFEHFADPAGILSTMNALLRPDGEVIISFGPTWYHPLGGHLFSPFPWAHLVFSEESLIRWRSTFKKDAATRFSEVAGGLNQMTISRFERLIAESPLRVKSLELVPIKELRYFHNGLTREFTTSIVRCRLVKRAGV